ncbi:MAG TPA: hypothetical protein VGC72_00140 [Candidatus Elarobacter sp.]|jgi:hypothetical protein
MKLHGVRPVLAVAVFASAVLAACGGGGGGGGTGGGVAPPVIVTPTPVPTATPPAPNFVKGVSGVAQIPQIASNTFSSSMLGASANGTFVIQSADTPRPPSTSSFTLTEYDVTASESAAGLTSSTSKARIASSTGREGTNTVLPSRPHLDPRTEMLQTLQLRSPRTVVQRARSTQTMRRVSAFAVGTTRTFHVQQGTITGVGGTCTPPKIVVGSGCYIDRPTHLRSVSVHAYVWVDDAIDATYNLTQADWDATSATFDGDFARLTTAFAPAFNAGLAPFDGTNNTSTYQQCGTNGSMLAQSFPPYQATPDLSGADPHISILVTNALENTGEGGYFDFSNDLNDQELNCSGAHVPSNNLPMFVIASDKYGSSNTADEVFWRTQDMPRSVPHEFQHYLNALNKVLVPDLVTGGARGVFDEAFVNEGQSMLAEDLVLQNGANPPQSPDSRFIAWFYMFSPGNYSLTAFAGYDQDPLSNASTPTFGFFRATVGNYGGAYLFARYLYDRFGGDAALHRSYADLTARPANSANVAPIQVEANGESFAQVYGEFAAALAARNIASGGDPRFTFSSNVLLNGLTTVPRPGGAPINVRFDGPRSPEDLTSATPSTIPRIKLTPGGGSVSMKLITGATIFPNVAPAGGAVVSGTVSGAPGLGVNSALVQGSYDDNGACAGAGCT